MKLIGLLLCILTIHSTMAAWMKKIKFDLEEYPEAQCLDGSPAAFYHLKGSGDGANKWVVYFEGGGVCLGRTPEETLNDCYKRSFGVFGTSTLRPGRFPAMGVLQTSEKKNPQFHNWNKLYIIYCAGAVHQGYQPEPYVVKGRNLYIKGLVATMSTFDYAIKNLGLGDPDVSEVLLTGSSAGGLGTFYYADILKNLLPASVKYWAAPDSGFFINYYFNDPTTYMKEIMDSLLQLGSLDYIIPQGCPYLDDENQRYKCVLPSDFAQKIESDLFIIESDYDAYNVRVFLGIHCVKHRSYQYCTPEELETIQNFRKLMMAEVENVLAQKENANAWLVSCAQHTFFVDDVTYNGGKFEVPMHSGNTPQDALYEWMYADPSQRKNSIDDAEWPLNLPCNGYDLEGETVEEYEDRLSKLILELYEKEQQEKEQNIEFD